MDQTAVLLEVPDDVVYAPDQPLRVRRGPDRRGLDQPRQGHGTGIVRKRLDGTSAFLLAIDSQRITFILRLTNGRVTAFGADSGQAPRTRRDLRRHAGGAVHQRGGDRPGQAVGTIAAGAGPLFIGNDASGRRRGTIDSVWLNTLAAPADVIRAHLRPEAPRPSRRARRPRRPRRRPWRSTSR
jgi:hypothetical protein